MLTVSRGYLIRGLAVHPRLVMILFISMVLLVIIAHSDTVELGVKVGDVYRYRGVYRVYGAEEGASGNPLVININVVILGFINNTVIVREEYRLEIPLNNTSLPKGVETYPIVFLEPTGFSINYSLIPYVISLDTAKALWDERISELKIEFWNLENTSIRIDGIIDTAIGKCKCLTIKGYTMIWRIVQRNISATLCYNEKGLLGYAVINTTKRIGNAPPKKSIYELEVVNEVLGIQNSPQNTTTSTSTKGPSTITHNVTKVATNTIFIGTSSRGIEKAVILAIILVIAIVVLGIIMYLKKG